MNFFDNRTSKLGDDLKLKIKNGSKIQVAASVFSMYGFQALKKELSKVEEFNFIFKDSAFSNKKNIEKEEKFFEIKRAEIERSIGGTKFEVQLKNEMTQRIIAKECAKWIKKKATFKANNGSKEIKDNYLNIVNDTEKIAYGNTHDFSNEGFGYYPDNTISYNIMQLEEEYSKNLITSFEELWNQTNELTDITNKVIDFIETLYLENSPEYIYYITLFNIFSEFLEDINEDTLANEKIGFKDTEIYNKLYDFQRDAVTSLINKLETHNGCILADSVGLGKTYTALAVIKYYELRNKNVLVLCPKKLSENWNTYRSQYKDNELIKDKFGYQVLFHTDLNRKSGMSNGIDLARLNWENYDLIVIDESHNFRNNNARRDRRNRYQILLEDVIKKGVQTKVLMLSATPVNNKFMDLSNQLNLAYEGRVDSFDPRISDKKTVKQILKDAQTIFNDWSKKTSDERTNETLYFSLNQNYEFFKLLDSVTIARSRKHIEKSYNMDSIGEFPIRKEPINYYSELTSIEGFMTIHEVFEELVKLNLSVYNPFNFILPARVGKYEELYDTMTKSGSRFRQNDRERSLQTLMRINFMKRLESSVHSFIKTMTTVLDNINKTLDSIEKFRNNQSGSVEVDDYGEYSVDDDFEDLSIGNKIKIELEDIDIETFSIQLNKDKVILESLVEQFKKIDYSSDLKINQLRKIVVEKMENPINNDNKKVIIFTSFADTATYLYEGLNDLGNVALITGSNTNKCTLNIKKDFNNLLMNFSPISKSRELLQPDAKDDIDILIATDCISEGQNLQDCDFLINYDIHWNPVRIIQRFGRIDRIGSRNKYIQLVNFWPNVSLDEYINLKNRVEDRMQILNVSATGSDNPLDSKEQETEFRKVQLKKLQEEVIDLEDISNTISLTDLGLNEFRMDLLEYTKTNGDISNVSSGMHSVINSKGELEPGIMFVLKNINNEINSNQRNQIHPFYIVYVNDEGKIIYDHLKAKETLDFMRRVCKSSDKPIESAYKKFNEITDDGRHMKKYSELLNQSINSIVSINEISQIDSLFSNGGIVLDDVKGLDDFELLTFLVIVD